MAIYHLFVHSADLAFKYEKADEWRLSKVKRSARSVNTIRIYRTGVDLLIVLYRAKRLVDRDRVSVLSLTPWNRCNLSACGVNFTYQTIVLELYCGDPLPFLNAIN